MTDNFDFQITNHNYILADLIGQKQGRKPLFPGYGAMVFDESHKLIDAARQMYSTVWDEQDAEFIVGLSEVNRRTTGMDELTVLRSQLAEYNRQIFGRLAGDLAGNHTREGGRIEIVIGSMEKIYMRHMAKALEQLPLSYQENSGQKMRMQGLKKRCQELTDKLTVFLNSGNSICWMEKRENGRLALCAVPMELEQVLFRDIWSSFLIIRCFLWAEADWM
jgi:ATP-dependent DNA helicase DinG